MKRGRSAVVAIVAATLLAGGLTAVSAPAAVAAEIPVKPLADTPPLGWNSWNTFECDINEQLIRDAADALIESGMRDAGYEYVNIDDCWSAPERDENDRLQPDPIRFPNGIKALADYMHERGLKLGIYSSAGTLTCQDVNPGSLGYEQIDAETFAEWEVDLLKYDNCHHQNISAKIRYQAMGEALASVDRDILYSLCNWGLESVWQWGSTVGAQMWRSTGDINPSWSKVMENLDEQVGLEQYSGPNAWNDIDMLEVGNEGLTYDESRAHMSLWALMNSPLIAGNDIRDMPEETVKLLTDADVLRVNQDWGGIQGHKIRDDGDVEVYAKPMSDGGAAVVFLNRSSTVQTVQTAISALDIDAASAYTVKNVWDETTVETLDTVRTSVASHGAEMFLIEPAAPGTASPAVTAAGDVDGIVLAGEPVAVSTTLFNDGATAVQNASLTLEAPAGWTVTGNGVLGTVAAGQAPQVSWTLTPAAGTAVGRVDLEVSGSWTWNGGAPLTDTATLNFTTSDTVVPSGTHWLSDVSWAASENFYGPVERDKSNGNQAAGDGMPLKIGTTTYAKGLGVHADSNITYFVDGTCTLVSALVGIDAEVGTKGLVEFEIWGDGVKLVSSGQVKGGQAAVAIAADLAGVNAIELRVNDLGDPNNDHADWANAQIFCDAPADVVVPVGTHYLSDVPWAASSNFWGPVERNRTVGQKGSGDGGALKVAGTTYAKGLGAHAPSTVTYALNGNCSEVTTLVGIDDAAGAGKGLVEFEIWGDGVKLAASGQVVGSQVAKPLAADLEGVTTLQLRVAELGSPNNDHADWINTQITCAAPAPQVDVTAEASVRCVAGKGVLAVQARNSEDAVVDLVVASAYGTKNVADLGADKRSTQSFTTRLASVPAGTVTVIATLDGTGSTTIEAPYSAANCN